jgi:hypothetical protein
MMRVLRSTVQANVCVSFKELSSHGIECHIALPGTRNSLSRDRSVSSAPGSTAASESPRRLARVHSKAQDKSFQADRTNSVASSTLQAANTLQACGEFSAAEARAFTGGANAFVCPTRLRAMFSIEA